MGVGEIKRLFEIKIGFDTQNLESFQKAGKSMKKAMDYQMAKAVSKVVKSHKGAIKLRDAFLKLLEDISSFRKDKIPLKTLRRMVDKNVIQINDGKLTSGGLKKTNPRLHQRLKVM